MPNLLRARLVQDEAVTAAAAVRSDDLPVNPLSLILYTIRARVTTAFTIATLANLLGVMSRIEVLYKGQAIVSASLADLYMVAYYLLGRPPLQGRKSDAAAAARVWITVPILFGRLPMDPNECFPAVRRGEFQLQSTPAASFTNIDNVTLQVETVELLEAAPKAFLKYTTISKTPAAVGDHDVDLPIGNPMDKLVLFGTTVPADGADTASIGQLRLLMDNVEYGYAFANWESLKGHEPLWCDPDWQGAGLVSRLAAGAPAGDAATEQVEWPAAFWSNYACLPFGLRQDDTMLLQTEGRSRVHLRINADVADAIRVLPVELLAVGGSVKPA
jgi:hypothetical protein